MNDALGWLLAVHLAATAVMWTLIAFVQAVHYPMFALVQPDRYREFQTFHMNRITWIVLPALACEGLIAGWFVCVQDGLCPTLANVGGGLYLVNFALTFLGAVPLHERLATGFDDRTLKRLLRVNLARCALQTGRLIVAALLAAMGRV